MDFLNNQESKLIKSQETNQVIDSSLKNETNQGIDLINNSTGEKKEKKLSSDSTQISNNQDTFLLNNDQEEIYSGINLITEKKIVN